jgi:Ca2+/Na+ antiporter
MTKRDSTIPKRQGEKVPYQKDKERKYHTKNTRRDTTGMVVSIFFFLVWYCLSLSFWYGTVSPCLFGMIVSILVFQYHSKKTRIDTTIPKRQGEKVPYQKDKERHYHTKKTRIDTTIPKREGEKVPYQKDKERQYHSKKTRIDTPCHFGMVLSLFVVLVWYCLSLSFWYGSVSPCLFGIVVSLLVFLVWYCLSLS